MKVPWMPKEEISGQASRILADYQSIVGHPVTPPIPVEDIIERYLGLRLSFEDLDTILKTDDVLGATYVKMKRICINERLLEKRSEGRMIFTCAHEAGHWVLHRRFVDAAGRTGRGDGSIICRTIEAKKPIEWQADYFAACLLLPEEQVRTAFQLACGSGQLILHNIESSLGGSSLYVDPCVQNWHLIASVLREAGGFTNVSKQAIIIRLQELGLLVNMTGKTIGWDGYYQN